MSVLTIPRPIATRLLAQAQGAPEDVVCGLVGGRDGRPCSIYPLRNAAGGSPIALDAEECEAAQSRIRERDEQILAVYHSHPATPPTPTEAELAAHPIPDTLMLIISLDIRGVLEMRAFEPDRGLEGEVPLRVFL